MNKQSKQRRSLFAKNPACYWCERITTLYVAKDGEIPPDNMATIDHLRSRFNPRRKEPNPKGEKRRVLACHKCNQKRGRLEWLIHEIAKQEKNANKGS